MENQDIILDGQESKSTNGIEEQRIISVNKFVFLSLITFGVYEIWWLYKAWKFYQQKEKLDIMPAARAIFSIFFLHALFVKILDFAKSKGYQETYAPTPLFIGFFLLNVLSKLPDPFWLVSLFAFIFLIPAFKALNYAMQNSDDFKVTDQTSFSGRQIGLIVAGIAFWALVIAGMMMEEA